MNYTPEEIQLVRERAMNDTLFLARYIIGNKSSKIEYKDVRGILVAENREGEQYGISKLTPHKKICELLDRPSLRKHIEAPRGAYKSTILAAYCIRRMLKDPNIRIFYAMATKPEAEKKLEAIKKILETNVTIKLLFGVDENLKGDEWRKGAFTIATRTKVDLSDPTMQIGAVDMERTGVHCDVLIADDIVTADYYRTPNGPIILDKYWKDLQPFADPGATIIEMGTRKADSDLHARFLEEPLASQYDTIVLGCGMDLAKNADGKDALRGDPIFPFQTKEFLRYKLDELGARSFSMEYLNNPVPAGLAYFTREQFKVCQWSDDMHEMAGYIVTDVATTSKEDSCFSVLGVVAMDRSRRAYLLDMWIGKDQSNLVSDKLIAMYEDWIPKIHIHKILLEEVALTQVFKAHLDEKARQKQLYLPLEGIRRGSSDPSKDQRIQRLTARFAQGRFLVCQTHMPRTFENNGTEILWDPDGYRGKAGPPLPSGELINQFIRYPAWQYRDIPDALADIDGQDKDGNWICPGSGIRSDRKQQKLKRQAGRFVRTTEVQGIRTQIEIGTMSQNTGHWSRLAEQLGM